jgi:hypothetical protein
MSFWFLRTSTDVVAVYAGDRINWKVLLQLHMFSCTTRWHMPYLRICAWLPDQCRILELLAYLAQSAF